MRRAAVFVFPTLCEGRARVVLEAAASGCVVVTTPNSGCEDIIEDGANGWLVQPRDVAALAERLQWCLDNPQRLREMGAASMRKASAWGEREFSDLHAGAVREFLQRKSVPAPMSATC